MARRARKQETKSRRGGKTKAKLSLKLKVLIGLGLLSISALLLCIGSYYGVRSYLQKDSFRAKLETLAQNHLQADYARITHNLELGDEQVSLQSIELGRNDVLQALALKGMQLNFKQSALYDRRLHLTLAKLDSIELQLDLNKKNTELPEREEGGSSIFDSFVPLEYQVDQIRCKDASLQIISDDSTYTLSNFALAAEPTTALSLDSWKIALRRGYISTPFQLIKKCRVESANINITPEGYTLDDCRIMLTPGDIQVKASYNKKAGEWTADVKSNKANVKHILNESWKARISGNLFCNTILRGDNDGVTIANGRLYLQNGIVEALPFISDFKIRNSYPYRHLLIDRASCRLTYPYVEESLNISEAWLFDDIDICSEGKIQIKGHVIIGKDRSLGGSLLIGLPQAVVSKLSSGEEGAVSQIFNAGSDESYAWLRINLSGTLDDPKQDLSIRLEQMAATYALGKADAAANTIFSVLGIGSSSKFEDNSDEDSDAEEQRPEAKKKPSAIDHGADSARGLLESIF